MQYFRHEKRLIACVSVNEFDTEFIPAILANLLSDLHNPSLWGKFSNTSKLFPIVSESVHTIKQTT